MDPRKELTDPNASDTPPATLDNADAGPLSNKPAAVPAAFDAELTKPVVAPTTSTILNS
jgi:hypothetical protein